MMDFVYGDSVGEGLEGMEEHKHGGGGAVRRGQKEGSDEVSLVHTHTPTQASTYCPSIHTHTRHIDTPTYLHPRSRRRGRQLLRLLLLLLLGFPLALAALAW